MKQAATNSDDEDEDSETEEVLKKAVEPTKKRLTDVPLILAPSQLEAESNPWLTTTDDPVLPSSEYSKPVEVRNDDQSSSSDSDDDEVQEGDKSNTQDQLLQEPTKSKSIYGATSQEKEHLEMPAMNKSNGKEHQQPQEATRQHQMNIQEAFADDDVLAEFEKDKVIERCLRSKMHRCEYI